MSAQRGVDKYFIAIVPPPPVYDQAQALKEYFKDHYSSKAALRSPPHITLHMPFEWKATKEDVLIKKIAGFSKEAKRAVVELKDFGCFESRVIFINVSATETLRSLQESVVRMCRQKLNVFNGDYRDRPYHPHLTVAFRDLKKAEFRTAWDEFKDREFRSTFTADRLSLLKHDGKRWNVLRDLELGV